MNIDELLRDLIATRDRIDAAIKALQPNLPRKRGRPSNSTQKVAAHKRRGRPPLSPAQKKALSERMKAAWAARKAAARK